MSKYDWLLFLHITFAFLFVAGAVIAGVFQFAAMKRSRPSEIAMLFRATIAAEILIGVGSIGALGLGIWLTDYLGYGFGTTWIIAALCLWVAGAALGGLGGRTYKKARLLAEELAAGADEPSDQLRALVRDRTALVLSYASTAAVIAILVLMVWKPGT